MSAHATTSNRTRIVDSAGSFWRCSVLGQVDDINSKLDPISVLAVLALLKFKKTGTLIGFNRYLITTEPPSKTQGVFRTIFGESREDLAIIPTVIEKAAKWFHPELEDNTAYRALFTAALQGLSKLQKTYSNKGSEVTASAISDWMKLITQRSKVLKGDVDQREILAPPLDMTAQKVFDIWSTSEIKELNSLIEQMNTLQGDFPPDTIIKCEDQIARLEFLLSQKAVKLQGIHEG